MARLGVAAAAGILISVTSADPLSAGTQDDECPHVVLFALPGATWSDVRAFKPPELAAIAHAGAAGSMSVRTNSSRTSYASGFATMGGGARLDGIAFGEPLSFGSAGPLRAGTRVAGLQAMRELAEDAGYGAKPGALGEALGGGIDRVPVVAIGNADLGRPPPSPAPDGYGRWTLLTAMDHSGEIDREATGPDLLAVDDAWPFGVRTHPPAAARAVDAALDLDCSVLVIDQGDLIRADRQAEIARAPLPQERGRAFLAADELLGYTAAKLDFDSDLLLVVSPTSPAFAPEAHLGIAVALGPGYTAGQSLTSASTRRYGVVTLPDVAPTVLAHAGIARPAEMNGRAFDSVPPHGGDRISAAIDLDRESAFVDGIKGPINAWFVVGQVILYVLVVSLLWWRERGGRPAGHELQRWLEAGALALVAFPIATFLAGVARAHVLGALPYVLLLLGTVVLLVAIASWAARDPLDRLLLLSAFTFIALSADLISGARLQLNTVFGYSPIVGGRFAGAGNIAFAVLGAATVLTGSLLVHRMRAKRRALALAALVFVAAIVVDGAPRFGSDIGGVIALVPALSITWLLLAGRRPSWRMIGIVVASGVVALAVFLAVDLAGPASEQTHLGRLFEDVRTRGPGVLIDTIERKAEANLRVFTTTVWTIAVPPALAVMAYLVMFPSGRWERVAERFPKLRAGLVGGIIAAVIGFAVNDSGIVIPAVILGFLVPMALLVHLAIERGPVERS